MLAEQLLTAKPEVDQLRQKQIVLEESVPRKSTEVKAPQTSVN